MSPCGRPKQQTQRLRQPSALRSLPLPLRLPFNRVLRQIPRSLRPRARGRSEGRRRARGVLPLSLGPLLRATGKESRPMRRRNFARFFPLQHKARPRFSSLPVLESGREETPGSGLDEGRAQPACARLGSRRSCILGCNGRSARLRPLPRSQRFAAEAPSSFPGERYRNWPPAWLTCQRSLLFLGSEIRRALWLPLGEDHSMGPRFRK